MYDRITDSLVIFGLFLFILAVRLIFIGIKKWRLKSKPATLDNKAVLFSYYSTGNNFFAADRQELPGVGGGASCTTIITAPPKSGSALRSDVSAPSGRAIVLVELPFCSRLHVLAISQGGNLEQLDPTEGSSVMHKVELEGDFPNYFTIYIDKEDDFQLRYIVDPEAMEFVVDFCRKYHWEIVDDTIYIVAKLGVPDKNLIERFIKEVRPALEEKSSSSIRANQYKQKVWPQPSKFKCPICAANLGEYRYWYECPNGHGQLMLGANLIDDTIREEYEENGEQREGIAAAHQMIMCPACGAPTEVVKYGGSKIMIDTCTKCHYRWFDAGEWKGIINRFS